MSAFELSAFLPLLSEDFVVSLPRSLIYLDESTAQISEVPEANWAICGLVIFGAHPAKPDVRPQLYALGIERFYAFIENLPRYKYPLPTGKTLTHVALPDKKPIPSNKLKEFILTVFDLGVTTLDGKMSYVHCWGGHGRSGLAICLLYHFLFGMNAEEAMETAQRYHDMRVSVPPDKDRFGKILYPKVRVPQTDQQRDQLRVLLSETVDPLHPEYDFYLEMNKLIKAKRAEIVQILSER
jgi:hypothetical protein